MSRNRILLIIFLVAVLLRVGGNIVREKVFFHKPFLLSGDAYRESFRRDAMWYDGTARAFLKGRGVSSVDLNWSNEIYFVADRPWVECKKIDENYFAHKAVSPFYPLFLALCYYLGGVNTLSYFIPQVILGSLTCVFIYLLAKEIFNGKVATVAAFIVAFYPDLIFWTYKVRTETLFIFLLTLGFLLLVRGNSQEDIFLIFISAVIFGLACLTRITFIPFIPLLFLWQILFFKKDRKTSLVVGFLMVLLIILVLLPWSVRNFLVFSKFTPFSDEAYAFLFQDGPHKIEEARYYFRTYNSLVTRIIGFVKDRPREYFLSSLRRWITFWSPYTLPMKKIAKIYKGLSWLIIFPLGFWGIIASRRNWKKCGLIIVFIFFHSLFHAASFVDSGLVYRYPIQPFICIFTAYGFWVVYEKLNPKENLVG